jgi:hypothetical protein
MKYSDVMISLFIIIGLLILVFSYGVKDVNAASERTCYKSVNKEITQTSMRVADNGVNVNNQVRIGEIIITDDEFNNREIVLNFNVNWREEFGYGHGTIKYGFDKLDMVDVVTGEVKSFDSFIGPLYGQTMFPTLNVHDASFRPFIHKVDNAILVNLELPNYAAFDWSMSTSIKYSFE